MNSTDKITQPSKFQPEKLTQRGMLHHILPLLFVVVFAIVGVGYVVASHAEPSSMPEIVSGIASTDTWCINDKNDSSAAENPVTTAKCNGSPAQHWSFENGLLEINLNNTEHCIEPQYGASASLSRVVLDSCNGQPGQKWLRYLGGFENVTASSGKITPLCLDVYGGKTGRQLRIKDCNADSTQQWKITSYPANAPKQISWIIGAHAVSLLRGVGASSTLISTAFNNSHSYVTSNSLSSIGLSAADPVADYASYQAIQAAFADRALPGDYKAVLYDNEDWSFTPKVEQQNPDHYERLTATIVHAHGLLYIATPGTDIVRSSGNLVNNSEYDTYLSRNIAGVAARYADVIDIQAQGIESNLPEFTDYVTIAAQQARRTNPTIKVLVGLSTNPIGKQITGQQLYSAYSDVKAIADGYWLNIPGQSAYCPQCGTPQPKVGLYLLQKIYGTK